MVLYASYVCLLHSRFVKNHPIDLEVTNPSFQRWFYHALDTTIVEADWLRELLMDLPIAEKPLLAILMNCDNQTVIVKVDSSKDNMKSSRHIKRQWKSIRKMRNSGVSTLDYIHTVTQTLSDRRSLETQTASHTLFGSSRTMSDGTGHCLLGGVWKCDFLPKFSPFFPSLILKL
jgi:mRNA-degrading endonuclease YafQ of YafQ-DinJ toxin-antitoxin module